MRWIGLTLSLFVTITAIVMGGGRAFLNVPGITICALVTLGLSIATHGWLTTCKSLYAIRILFINIKSPINENVIPPLKSLIIYSYISGIAGWMIGNIQMLSNVSEFDPVLMRHEAFCLVTLFFSFIFSEYILRPTTKRIEQLLSNNAACRTVKAVGHG